MMSSGGNPYWCYQCHQPVHPSGNLVCPNCGGGFLTEIPRVVGAPPGSYLIVDPFHDPARAVEAFSAHIGRRMVAMPINQTVGIGPRPPGPFLIFNGHPPVHGHPPVPIPGQDPFDVPFSNGHPPVPIPGHDPFDVPFSNGYETELSDFGVEEISEELIEQLSLNDRQGPPPAPRVTIDSMPTIKITQRHLNDDAHCPVCQDKFELGVEAKKMPCEHIYHKDCIVPWLAEHNTCPVCRVELTSTGSSDAHPNSNRRATDASSSGSNRSRRRGNNSGRWNPFSFVLCLNPSNQHHSGSDGDSSSDSDSDSDSDEEHNCSVRITC